jgi:hypothetical protein
MVVRAALLLCVCVAGGCAHDLRTAVEHENLAAHHRANADQARAVVAVNETTRPMQSGSEMDMTGANRYEATAAGKGIADVETARKHDEAAQRIRAEAGIICSRVPASAQVSCPVDVRGKVEPIRNGVRIIVAGAASAEALRAQIECAMARTRVDYPADWATCPLYAPGAVAHVVDRPNMVAIDIVTRDEVQAAELRRRVAQSSGASNPP